MEVMFEGIVLTALDLDQDPQSELKNKMENFDEADLRKVYAWTHGNEDETVNIASRSRQIRKRLQKQTKTAYLPGLNLAPTKDPSIKSGPTKESAEDEDASLLGGASLDIDPEGDYISPLGDESSLTGGDVYLPVYESL